MNSRRYEQLYRQMNPGSSAPPAAGEAAHTQTIRFADRSAVALHNVSDRRFNNCSPAYRGLASINGTNIEVVSAANFSGVLHYGFTGYTSKESGEEFFSGWIPAFLISLERAE